jgi:hypothetical protein
VVQEVKFSFKVLIKREPDAWVARCLELGLVTVAETAEQAESDMIDVITAHVRYAIENDNEEHLFHPAPPAVWREFFACAEREEQCYTPDHKTVDESLCVMPVIETTKCVYRQPLHG